MKTSTFLLAVLFAFLTHATSSEIIECEFSENKVFVDKFTHSGYECKFEVFEEDRSHKIIINGSHSDEKVDKDVVIFANKYSEQKIENFTSAFCRKFENLEVVSIQYLKIDQLNEDSFRSCKNLKYISFVKNEIKKIPTRLLFQNSKLLAFLMDTNQLQTLPDYIFIKQTQLQQLSLKDNQINHLPSLTFKSLVNLKELNLQSNKLQFLDPLWFQSLQNLERLLLDFNEISNINKGEMKKLVNLNELHMYDNKIKILPIGYFEDIPKLKTLDFGKNLLSEIPENIFQPLKSLQTLGLNENNLTVIHTNMFGTHENLVDVLLQENYINAIDNKFIEITANMTINLENNVCVDEKLLPGDEIVFKLMTCFENYRQEESKKNVYSRINTIAACGKSLIGQGNIVGGNLMQRGSFPWIAALVSNQGNYFCGGTIISARKVVTAAHCIQDKQAETRLLAREFRVLLGVYDLLDPYEVGRKAVVVYRIHIHKDWNIQSTSFDADLAVLILEKNIEFDEHIQPICLVQPKTLSDLSAIDTGVVVGFGRSEDFDKIRENIPKVITVPIHTRDSCFLEFPDLVRISSRRTFCRGYANGTGVCSGDSGSGLVVEHNEAYFLRGIVSSSIRGGKYGCDVDSYSVFTDILDYSDWINEIGNDEIFDPRK